MANKELIDRLWTELEPVLTVQGFELVEVEVGRHGTRWLVRLYVDRQGGVTLDDCAALSRVLGPVLDTLDPVTESYVLEVSSPGFDRPIRKPGDFERFTGERIKVKTVMAVQGRSKFRGILRAFEGGAVSVDCDGQTFVIDLNNVSKANLDQ